MTVIYVGNKNDDGTCLGQSGDKIGFYGTTPVAKTSVSNIVAGTPATISQVGTSGKWAFATSTAAIAAATALSALKKLGLF